MSIAPLAAAMLVYGALLGLSLADATNPLAAFLIAPVMYVTAIYLYFGLAQLAFSRWMWGLLVLTVAAAALSVLMSGGSQLWSVITGWSLIAVTAVTAGRLTSRGARPRTAYIAAVASVVVFGVALYLPTWLQMAAGAPDNVRSLVAEAQRQLTAIGESEQRSRQIIEAFRTFVTVLFRLAPAVMILSVIAQFSIGYLLFARWISRRHSVPGRFDPFHYWKMPFGCVPLVAAAAAVRLAGGPTTGVIADNALALLAVFYTLTGLSLVEYGLRKIQFSRFMRLLFYLFLALLPLAFPLVGIIACGAMILLGFVDSFADWRRVRLREFV